MADPSAWRARPQSPAEREALASRTHSLLRQAAAVPRCRSTNHDAVVTDHLWLADVLARRFHHRGEDPEDVLQVARIGLVEAVQRFDPAQPSFIAFAVPTITGVLKRHFRDRSWTIRPPRQTQELAAQVWREWPSLAQQLGGIPTSRDLAERVRAPLASVEQARRASQCFRATSLEALGGLVGVAVSVDAVDDLERCEARVMVDDVLDRLEPSERRLLWLRYGEQRSQAEIAVAVGTSQMQVSRMLARLLAKVRVLVGAESAAVAA